MSEQERSGFTSTPVGPPVEMPIRVQLKNGHILTLRPGLNNDEISAAAMRYMATLQAPQPGTYFAEALKAQGTPDPTLAQPGAPPPWAPVWAKASARLSGLRPQQPGRWSGDKDPDILSVDTGPRFTQ